METKLFISLCLYSSGSARLHGMKQITYVTFNRSIQGRQHFFFLHQTSKPRIGTFHHGLILSAEVIPYRGGLVSGGVDGGQTTERVHPTKKRGRDTTGNICFIFPV